MALFSRRWRRAAVSLLLWMPTVWALADKVQRKLSLQEIDAQLQDCAIVQHLNAQHAQDHGHSHDAFLERLFQRLFPGGPAVNALLATVYISGPPNLLLALCPPHIDPASLSVMVAFAVGGLLGDTFFHLLPEIFLGEEESEGGETRAKFMLVEPNRNLLLGLAILVGFFTFVAMDKGLRIATGRERHDHGNAHAHAHGSLENSHGASSAVEKERGEAVFRRKNSAKADITKTKPLGADDKQSVKLGGFLNLIADFTHNITDGLAMAASFYASPTVGASTTLAVFLHEIPHEVGDFALLIQSGFSKRAAMGAQFITAIGAFLGTLIGIAVQEMGGAREEASTGMAMDEGLWGTSLAWNDMLLPFTAGTFLYVGTVAVIPELLETNLNKATEITKTLKQFAAIALGAGVMLYISWH